MNTRQYRIMAAIEIAALIKKCPIPLVEGEKTFTEIEAEWPKEAFAVITTEAPPWALSGIEGCDAWISEEIQDLRTAVGQGSINTMSVSIDASIRIWERQYGDVWLNTMAYDMDKYDPSEGFKPYPDLHGELARNLKMRKTKRFYRDVRIVIDKLLKGEVV